MFDKMNLGITQIPGFQEEPACAKLCPNLSYKHRVMGFAGCAGLGYMLSFMGTMTLIGGPTEKNIITFAILYVIGNVVAICATGFLVGPKKHCIQMWDATRRYSTAFYLSMLIIVFAVAVAKQHVVLVLFLLFVEILAGIWYSASYVPFGRKIIIAFLRRTICKPCFEAYDSVKGAGGAAGASSSGGSSAGFSPVASK